jgi:iron(III) transport system ATP-binding protein
MTPGGAATPTTDKAAEKAPPGVRVTGAVKHFGRVAAVDGVTLQLARGQLMALLGPSGCGKTTLLRLIAGFEQLDGGRIEVGGALVAAGDLHVPPERRRIGMVFQEYALFPHLNVHENVRFGLRSAGADGSRRVDEVLELVGLAGLGQRLPHELSGGQQQRVALARALAPEPAVVLLDEPFSNLDAGLRVRVRSEVRAILKAAGATAIFVTHDQEEALSLVDRVAVLMRGEVRQVATPQLLYRQPADREVAEFVGNANFVPGAASGRSATCELGALDLQSEVRGPVDLLLRPENVALAPAAADSPSRIRSIAFFGHDQLIGVQLGSGREIEARMGPDYVYAVGQPVSVRVMGPVMAYPSTTS